MKMTDVVCLGEAYFDVIASQTGTTVPVNLNMRAGQLPEGKDFLITPGGALTTAVCLARLGVSTSFLGSLSQDFLGDQLLGILETEGVCTERVVSEPQTKTRISYVGTDRSGESYVTALSVDACADECLAPRHVEHASTATILHVSSFSLINDSNTKVVRRAIELAQTNNVVVCFGLNSWYRLRQVRDRCKEPALRILREADVVIMSVQDLSYFRKTSLLDEADKLRGEFGVPLVIITLGWGGAYYTGAAGCEVVAGFTVETRDTTGAREAFIAGILSGLLPHVQEAPDRRAKLVSLTKNDLASIVNWSNALAAMTCEGLGAIPSLPAGKDEVGQFIATSKQRAWPTSAQ